MLLATISNTTRPKPGRLRRWRGLMPSALAFALLGGCVTPEGLQRKLDELQPAALAAAKERARADLGCDEPIATEVLSRSPGGASAYSLDRAEYKIAATGCHKRIPLVVACTAQSLCSALAQDAVVESVPRN